MSVPKRTAAPKTQEWRDLCRTASIEALKELRDRRVRLTAILQSAPLEWWPAKQAYEIPPLSLVAEDEEGLFVGPELPVPKQSEAKRRRDEEGRIGSLNAAVELRNRLLAVCEIYDIQPGVGNDWKTVLRLLSEDPSLTALHVPNQMPYRSPPVRHGAPLPALLAPTPPGTIGLSPQTVWKLRRARKYIAGGMSRAAAYREVAADWNDSQSVMKAIDRTYVEDLLTWTAVKQLDHQHRDHQMPSPVHSDKCQATLSRMAWQRTLEFHFSQICKPRVTHLGQITTIVLNDGQEILPEDHGKGSVLLGENGDRKTLFRFLAATPSVTSQRC